MKINNKEIKHNQHLTFAQLENIEKKYDTLEAQLEKKFGVLAYYERSSASEAAYFTIEREDETSIEISIRNHENKYSEAELIWMSEYENWTALKKEVFAIVENFIKGTYETQKEQIAKINI